MFKGDQARGRESPFFFSREKFQLDNFAPLRFPDILPNAVLGVYTRRTFYASDLLSTHAAGQWTHPDALRVVCTTRAIAAPHDGALLVCK